MSTFVEKTDLLNMSDVEIQAQDLVKCGKIDEAIVIYQQLKPDSVRIFNIIGMLYAERKGDFVRAIASYEKALQIQEENGDDTSDSLTELGFAYQNLRDFDSALIYHCRALSIRQMTHNIDPKLIVNNLFGIANAHWGQQNLSEALNYAKQALTLNKSIKSGNDFNLVTNLAILANIYHQFGDDIRALEFATQALTILERCVPSDSSTLVALLNNIGAIQVGAGLVNDALLTFIRVLYICEKTLPQGHQKRVAIETNIRRLIEMQQRNNVNDVNSYVRSWKFLTKIFIL